MVIICMTSKKDGDQIYAMFAINIRISSKLNLTNAQNL